MPEMKSKLVLACLALAACASADVNRAPVIVDFYFTGHDSITQHLTEMLENRLRSTTRFRLAGHEERADVAVNLSPIHIPIVRGVEQVRYEVVFTRIEGVEFGRSFGTCDLDRLEDCTSRILFDFARALRRAGM